MAEYQFPCMMACPAHTNAGRYVRSLRKGSSKRPTATRAIPIPWRASADAFARTLAKTACRRGEIDRPISIRALSVFSPSGMALSRVIRLPLAPVLPKNFPTRSPSSEADQLASRSTRSGADGLLGHHLRSVAGCGRNAVPRNPEYRLPRSVVEAQVREILETGDITLRLNFAAGRDFTVGELRRQGFDAVLIAVGAHRSRDLSIPGVDLDGVHRGIEFLLNVNLGYKFTIGKRVLVIGGGNVAMDVARSAAREVLRQHDEPGEITPSKRMRKLSPRTR